MDWEGILKRLEERLANMSDEELEADYESITHAKFYKRWVDKIHNMPKDKRISVFSKVINKYRSDEYIKSEYKKGYEPRCPLYDLYYEYALIYGVSYWPDNVDNSFVNHRFIVDDTYITEELIGQGTVIDIYTIDEFNKHQAYLKECKEKYGRC